MNTSHWIFRAVAWDGILPIFTIAFPGLLNLAFPGPMSLGTGVLVLVITILAALIRARLAWGQLTEICKGRPTVLRQLGLAMAIIILLIMEICAGTLQTENDATVAAWAFVGTLYILYLFFVTLTLRPLSANVSQENELQEEFLQES